MMQSSVSGNTFAYGREGGAWREFDHCVRRRPPDCLPRDDSSPCVSEMIEDNSGIV